MKPARKRSGSAPRPAAPGPRVTSPAKAGPGSRSDRARAHALLLAAPLLLTVWAFLPALGMGFAGDDITFLSRAAGLVPSPGGWTRLLSGPLAWKLQYRLFGLDALPYNAVRLILHLVATTLVYRCGLRLLGGRPAAGLAALLFGVSVVAFTPLHSASGIGELMAGVFALGALALIPVPARGRGRGRSWASAASFALAILSKEVAILAILPMLAARWEWDGGDFRGRLGRVLLGLLPQVTVAAAFAIVLLAQARGGAYLGGAAYGVNLSPTWLIHHLLHYVRWAFDLRDPIPDRVAAAAGSLSLIGIGITVVIVTAITLTARRWRRAEAVGAVWFLALLALVLPLTAHSYLYYLYVPWAGACWCMASLAARAQERWPGRWTVAALAVGAVLYAGVVLQDLDFRGRTERNGLPIDRTVRESLLVRNSMAGIRQAGLTAPDSIYFVNPFPRVRQTLTGDTSSASGVSSYVPLAGALREGETLRLFLPGLRQLGFAERIPEEWEQASAFFYDNDGTLLHLGRHAEAHRRLGGMFLEAERWTPAETSFRRALALGDTSADAAYGFLFAIAGQDRTVEATRLAKAFVARWPGDGRSRFLVEGLASEAR